MISIYISFTMSMQIFQNISESINYFHETLSIRTLIDRRGNRAGLLIQLWIFTYVRVFDWLTTNFFFLYLPGPSVCDEPGK